MKRPLKIMMFPTFNRVPNYNKLIADACGQIRMLPHAKYLNLSDSYNIKVDVFRHGGHLDKQYLNSYDIIWANRDSLLRFENRDEIFDIVSDSSKKIIIDLDDAIFDIDSSHIESSHYLKLKADLKSLIDISDVVLCSTAGVKKSVERHCSTKETKIIRNALDTSWFRGCNKQKKSDEVRYYYYGTNTHKNDWRMIEPYIIDFARRNPRAQFILTGVVSAEDIKGYPSNIYNVEPPIYARFNYKAFFKFVAEDINPDFVLAPLEKTLFNQAKSELKALEAIAIGSVPIVSSGFEYDQLKPFLDHPVFYCENATDWCESFEKTKSDGLHIKEVTRRQCLAKYDIKNRTNDIAEILKII